MNHPPDDPIILNPFLWYILLYGGCDLEFLLCQKWDFQLGTEQESQTPTTHPNPKNSLFLVCFFFNLKRYIIDTLPETNMTSPLKMDGWNTKNFPIGAKGLFSGVLLTVSFREGNHLLYKQTFNHQALQAPAVPRLSFDPVAIGFWYLGQLSKLPWGKKKKLPPPPKKKKKNTCTILKKNLQKGFLNLPGAPPGHKKKNVTG